MLLVYLTEGYSIIWQATPLSLSFPRFVPDLEDIVSFEELVTGELPTEATEAAK